MNMILSLLASRVGRKQRFIVNIHKEKDIYGERERDTHRGGGRGE